MSKKKILFSAVAALLAFAIFSFSGCNAPLGEGTLDAAASGDAASRSLSKAQADLTGQTYFLRQLNPGVYGVSRIDFTSPTDATGQFGNTAHTFTYNLVSPALNQYSLSETGTPYTWSFNLNGNNLTFTGPFKPYSPQAETFVRIFFVTGQDLSNLSNTNWLGLGPRGESLLDQITSTSATTYNLTGSFGPDAPGPFEITNYTYGGGTTGTGKGTMNKGAGDFASDGATATLTFPNFWGHGVQVVFEEFTY
jgi:hypothetical protein